MIQSVTSPRRVAHWIPPIFFFVATREERIALLKFTVSKRGEGNESAES
jgi:hypothetical protein